jgi:hypothetical protein
MGVGSIPQKSIFYLWCYFKLRYRGDEETGHWLVHVKLLLGWCSKVLEDSSGRWEWHEELVYVWKRTCYTWSRLNMFHKNSFMEEIF